MVESVWSMVGLYGYGVSMVELNGQWCFNGGICMVNDVSMVKSVWSMVFQWQSLYGEWCFNSANLYG